MSEPFPKDAAWLDTLAHVTLQLGRILLSNGSDTEQVQVSLTRFAAAFGADANLLVTYEAVLVSLEAGGQIRTKVGHRVPGMGVGMAAIEAINRLVDDADSGRLRLAGVPSALDAIEHRSPIYPRWLVAIALGVTSASLSRLFGGDWMACLAAGLAGAVGTMLRLELGRRHVNPVLVAFVVALLSGIVGGLAVGLRISSTPALPLVAPAMILVPGVPLINGILDIIRNHVTIGLSRLGFASFVVLAIAFGIFGATRLIAANIPVDSPTLTISVAQDAIFSALAAGGFALLFNVPPRIAWACAICGVASHTLRTLLFHFGIDLITGTLAGALVVGFLAQGFARHFHAPAVALAFPGVVAMVPGAYAFRAVFGTLQIAEATATGSTITETLSLSATVGLMVGAIGVGVAAPALLFPPRSVR
ncbi:MAG TPA: threonine/serine exporter family protein [Rhodopila sp.]|nr:threonine/serine exporter family protein [Rhodopila sp.]